MHVYITLARARADLCAYLQGVSHTSRMCSHASRMCSTDADDDQDGLAGGWSVGPYIQVSILLECVLTFLERVLTLLECVLTLLECVVIMLSPNHNILETLQHLN